MQYPALFKRRYPRLKGKDWIRRIDPDDRRAFVQIGLLATENGHKGGKARAASATRDEKGRIV